jgi:hypothetical protein
MGEGDGRNSTESERNIPFLPCLESELTAAAAAKHDDIDDDGGDGRARSSPLQWR